MLRQQVQSKGHSSGYSTQYVSPFLRLNEDGQLVGKYLDVLGTSEGMRFGMKLPKRYDGYGMTTRIGDGVEIPNVPPPPGQESEVGVDFCLTWSTDPRWGKMHFEQICLKMMFSSS